MDINVALKELGHDWRIKRFTVNSSDFFRECYSTLTKDPKEEDPRDLSIDTGINGRLFKMADACAKNVDTVV